MERSIMALKLLFILCLTEIHSTESDIQFRILHGVPLKIEKVPYYAGLFNCGAAIISNTWILTAAHCMVLKDPIPPQYRYVWVGGESENRSQAVPYDKVIVHEEYSKLPVIINDIALIRLAVPLQFTEKIQPIKLPVGAGEFKKLMIVGRGRDETGMPSKYVKKLDLIRMPTKECISSLQNPMLRPIGEFLERTTICAKKGADKPSICYGDSGGPLVSGDTLVGLASFIDNRKCHEVRLGFYVNVKFYLPWIKKHTSL